MAVVVDDKVYPLHQSNLTSLLYTGDAPTPSQGYYFAKTSDGHHVTEREPFTRNLDGRPGDDIYYEVYNRSVNAHPMKDLPQYLEHLESIHRVDSDLHRYNEIATVHFTTANQSAIDYMHTNVTADFQVVCNMTYIRCVLSGIRISMHACMKTQFTNRSDPIGVMKSKPLTMWSWSSQEEALVWLPSSATISRFPRVKNCMSIVD